MCEGAVQSASVSQVDKTRESIALSGACSPKQEKVNNGVTEPAILVEAAPVFFQKSRGSSGATCSLA